MRFVLVCVVLASMSLAGCTAPDSSTGAGTSAGGTAGSGAAGGAPRSTPVVVVAVYRPVCGPEQRTPAPGCTEEPVAGVEVVATAPGGAVVARRHTDSAGRAVLDLPDGTVTLTASPAPPPRVTPRPTQVTVGSGPAPTVTLRYESSMQ